MAHADRWWRGLPVRAARAAAGAALLRVLVLAGLAVTGWLLGGVTAAAADDTGDLGLPAVSHLTDPALSAGSAPDSADAAPAAHGAAAATAESGAEAAERARLDSVGREVGRIVRHDPVGTVLPVVAEAGQATGASARQVVETAAATTGEVVSGTVRTGRQVGDSATATLEESPLGRTVSTSLTGSPNGIGEQLGGLVTETAAPVGLLPGEQPAEPADPVRDDSAADDPERTDGDARARRDEAARLDAPSPAAGFTGAAALAQRSANDQAAPQDDTDPLTPHGGSDSTGAVSSSSVPVPAMAGFLVTRSATLRTTVQRVALPGDPTLVVRDAADDPSFSPD
jgi:hypothetical protein